MNQICDERYAIHPNDYKHYDTRALRQHFLIENLFEAEKARFTYTHYDRLIVGGVKPVNSSVTLEPLDQLRAEYFLERRELGAINVGGAGCVQIDGERFELDYKDALYIGRGAKEVVFTSVEAATPAKFYLNSTPAHTSYPSRKVSRQEADVMELGSSDTSNERAINKLLVNSVLPTCQLQMGLTELRPGSIWNTMPCHTHSRRMEAYFYFEVPEEQAVCHFMGPPSETRHLWIANEQAVISPPWSIHSGAGTGNYTFIWGMAGENLDYGDIEAVTPRMLAGGVNE